jgi:hypothetical protein
VRLVGIARDVCCHRIGVEHVSTLAGPFIFAHWPIADYVLAEHVFNILHVTPAIWTSILQPDKRRLIQSPFSRCR